MNRHFDKMMEYFEPLQKRRSIRCGALDEAIWTVNSLHVQSESCTVHVLDVSRLKMTQLHNTCISVKVRIPGSSKSLGQCRIIEDSNATASGKVGNFVVLASRGRFSESYTSTLELKQGFSNPSQTPCSV